MKRRYQVDRRGIDADDVVEQVMKEARTGGAAMKVSKHDSPYGTVFFSLPPTIFCLW